MEILVFIVIVIVSIFVRSAKAKSDVDGQGNKKQQGMPPFNQSNYPRQMMGGSQKSGNQPNLNTPRTMSNQSLYSGEVAKSTVMSNPSVPANTIRPAYSSAKSTTAKSTTAPKKVVEKREENESVTDFLANKANKGRLQQESDVRDQSIKNEKFQSGRTSAERLIYGDPVPNDKRMIVCNYCGAENLIPHYAANYYKCYFCREDI